jgi:hypothetical protein
VVFDNLDQSVVRRFPSLKRPAILVAVLLLLANASLAIALKAETIKSFNKFIELVETRLEPRFSGRSFLWSDELPSVRLQLLKGEVVAQPMKGNGIVALKGGLVQDWRGAVFIPHATLPGVLAVVQDYNRHHDYYQPDVEASRLESRQGDLFLIYMRIVKAKLMLTDVLDTEHTVEFFRLDPQRIYSRSYSKRINEVAAAGRTDEHLLPVGQDRGMLWRLYGYWFYEERDGGVYVTCESITLTREIPFGMGLLLAPIIDDMPGDSLRISLEQTRKAVLAAH